MAVCSTSLLWERLQCASWTSCVPGLNMINSGFTEKYKKCVLSMWSSDYELNICTNTIIIFLNECLSWGLKIFHKYKSLPKSKMVYLLCNGCSICYWHRGVSLCPSLKHYVENKVEKDTQFWKCVHWTLWTTFLDLYLRSYKTKYEF